MDGRFKMMGKMRVRDIDCVLQLVPARVLSIASRAHANNIYLLLANQTATSHLGQSARQSTEEQYKVTGIAQADAP